MLSLYHLARHELTHLQGACGSLTQLSQRVNAAQRPQVSKLDEVIDLMLASFRFGQHVMLLEKTDHQLYVGKRKDVHLILRDD